MTQEIKIDCPFCGKEKHLSVNTEKGLYHCFRCKASGHVAPGSSVPALNTIPGSSRRSNSSLNKQVLRLGTTVSITPQDTLYWRYAEKRGALKYKDNLFKSARWPEYIIIGLPLLEKPDFYFGRKIMLAGPRYRYFSNTKGIICRSFKSAVESAVIVEGFFDLCKVSEFHPTIALLGKGWDDVKIEKIAESVKKKVYICLDRDAITDSIKLISTLPKRLEVKLLFTDLYKDPGSNADWIKDKLD